MEAKNTAKYTEGPWRNDGPQVFSRSIGREYIEYGVTAEATGEVVAMVHTLRGCERANADATLIAESPELLAACKLLVDAFETGHPRDDAAEIRHARNVIARAEGRTP
jgi:hypothetical protein